MIKNKRKKIIYVLFLLSLLLTSCKLEDDLRIDNPGVSIVAPKSRVPIEGSWRIFEQYSMEDGSSIDIEDLDSYIHINNNLVVIGDKYSFDSHVSSKYVDKDIYLNNKFLNFPENLNPEDKYLHIIRFDDREFFAHEILKTSDNELVVIQGGKLYVYRKENNKVPSKVVDKYLKLKSVEEDKSVEESSFEDTSFGLILGLRKKNSSEISSDYFDYSYKTYFIGNSEEELKPKVLATKDIVLPKDSGFWTIKSERKYENGFSIDNISAKPIALKEKENINYMEDSLYRRIDYVSKDFIALTNSNNLEDGISHKYEIYNIHNLAKKDPIKISDIAGKEGLSIYNNLLMENLDKLKNKNPEEILEYESDETNIGVKRQRGSWKFISNIDFKFTEENSRTYYDFYLDLIPNLEIFSENNNKFKWHEINSRVPGAIDWITSPNNSYILIQGDTEFQLYYIINGKISANPILSIQNVEGQEIILSEWTGGENVKTWYKNFLTLERVNASTLYMK